MIYLAEYPGKGGGGGAALGSYHNLLDWAATRRGCLLGSVEMGINYLSEQAFLIWTLDWHGHGMGRRKNLWGGGGDHYRSSVVPCSLCTATDLDTKSSGIPVLGLIASLLTKGKERILPLDFYQALQVRPPHPLPPGTLGEAPWLKTWQVSQCTTHPRQNILHQHGSWPACYLSKEGVSGDSQA